VNAELAPRKPGARPSSVRVPLAWTASTLSHLCDRLDAGEEPDAALVAVFNETKLEHADAVDRRIAFIKFVEGSIEGAKAAAREWDFQAKRLESLLAAMKERTKEILEAFPDLPYSGSLGKLAVQANGGKTPLELTFGDRELTPDLIAMFDVPPEFVKVTYTLNTDAVRAALEEGVELPWAKLGDRGRHLRVRT
jgi:hypothetical protein